jgi:SAM-dependent methyltransferase
VDGLAGTFDADAAGYATGRPGYPAETYEILEERCRLGPGTDVLEIGPGTGQATEELLRRGARVVAVEPGANLAEHLRRRLGGQPLTVVVEPFDSVGLGPARFDLVAAATSFHWLDPASRMQRARAVLRPGGWIALWWNVFHDPEQPDAFGRAIDGLYDDYRAYESTERAAADALDAETWLADLRAAGFANASSERIPWEGRHTTDEVVALFATYSSTRSLTASRREEYLTGLRTVADGQFGGVVSRPYITALYTAQNRG